VPAADTGATRRDPTLLAREDDHSFAARYGSVVEGIVGGALFDDESG
jgi:hypothetical protein